MHYLLVVPLGFLWRYVVVPVAREVGAALALAWRGTAYVSRAVGRAIGWVCRVLIATPVAFVWNLTLGPVLRWCVRAVLRPAAEPVSLLWLAGCLEDSADDGLQLLAEYADLMGLIDGDPEGNGGAEERPTSSTSSAAPNAPANP